jgi:hypothetical protein
MGVFTSAVPSSSGHIRNCSGGVTPWGSWYTCEETDTGNTPSGGRRHGYVFEVGPLGPLPGGVSVPFPDMGNFSHEAMATDPATGITYLTEDGASPEGDVGSGFYRFSVQRRWQSRVRRHTSDAHGRGDDLRSISRRPGATAAPFPFVGSQSTRQIPIWPAETSRHFSRDTRAEAQVSVALRGVGMAGAAFSSYQRTEVRASSRPTEPARARVNCSSTTRSRTR